MRNPLYPSNIIDENSLRSYNRCIVITLEHTPIHDIFNKDITSDTYYKDIKNNYNVKSIPMWIIKLINSKINFIICNVSEDELLNFNFNITDINDNKISYNLSEAVILIPNHNWNWIFNYIEPYIKDGLYSMYKYLINTDEKLSQLFSNPTYNKLILDIESSLDVKYWKDINKCRINITSSWLSRDINFSDAKEININKQNEMNNKCNDYIQNINNKNKYVDASSGIKIHKYNLYYIEEYSNNSIDKMIEKLLFNTFNESIKEKIDLELSILINYCLISKKYCHLILKNNNILKYIKNNINQYSNAYSYAWLMMYIEEGILKSMIKETDRCVFTLDQANNLPITDRTKNMYLPMMVEKKYINVFGGYISFRKEPIMLSSLNQFKTRLNIFSNNHNIDIFKNLDWSNIAITGSVIPATCRIDPMEIDGIYSPKIFFNTYYNDSDIDVMIDIPEQTLFIDKINYFVSIINNNIREKFPNESVDVENHKTCMLYINKNNHINENITLDFAYELYCKLKEKEIKYTEEKYKIINKICSIDQFRYIIYKENETKEDNYNENIKYHVSSPFLRRKFEIFRIKYNFLSTVSRFHLPCVRGYYNGKDVYLLPSAISSLLTNICMDYKYFAGIRSPFEIILKYNFRGYSILLNKKEIIKIAEYIKNSDKWSKLYNCNNIKVNLINGYYTSPFVFLNSEHINYENYRYPIQNDLISPIVSSIGYIIPYKN
jgi:hypothetical protein